MRMLLQCALLLVTVGSAAAQEQAEITAHQRLAEELIAVLRLEEASTRGVEMMTRTMAAQNPAAAQIQDVMREFYEEFMSWDTLRPSYVKIYMDAFTEAELEGLIEFYHTPLGQRWVEQTPLITEQSAAATQAVMLPHLPELQRRMMEKMRGGGQ